MLDSGDHEEHSPLRSAKLPGIIHCADIIHVEDHVEDRTLSMHMFYLVIYEAVSCRTGCADKHSKGGITCLLCYHPVIHSQVFHIHGILQP